MATKLVGSVNLAKLENVGVMTINGKNMSKKCIVIPIEDNDIYVKVEEKVSKDGKKYTSRMLNLGVEVYERQNVSTFGATHYMKLSLSKDFVNTHSAEQIAEKNGVYFGDLKPVDIPSSNQASTIEAPVYTPQPGADDDLPF